EFDWFGTTVGQLSYYYHDDFREDVVYVDNRPPAALNADKGRSARIHTIGANLVHVVPLGPGAVDGLTYGYGQFGDWQSLTPRACPSASTATGCASTAARTSCTPAAAPPATRSSVTPAPRPTAATSSPT